MARFALCGWTLSNGLRGSRESRHTLRFACCYRGSRSPNQFRHPAPHCASLRYAYVGLLALRASCPSGAAQGTMFLYIGVYRLIVSSFHRLIVSSSHRLIVSSPFIALHRKERSQPTATPFVNRKSQIFNRGDSGPTDRSTCRSSTCTRTRSRSTSGGRRR